MPWTKEAISDGEIDALSRAARIACHRDTRYPAWRGSAVFGNGECYNVAAWLVHRLGGHVGALRGHYVWLSPDERYVIDLLGGHTAGWRYEGNDPADGDQFHRVALVRNARTRRFAKRADRIFDGLDRLVHLALDYAGDAYPGEEPQAADDHERFNDSWTAPEQYWHDEPDPITPEGVYQFVYARGQLEISPNHSHEDLAGHAGVVPAQHVGPFAAGHVIVTNGRATWEVQANINLHSFFRILKDATKNYGWQWGGMTDASGQPIIEQFAPKKSDTTLNYAYVDDHLYIGAVPPALLALSSSVDGGRAITGAIRISGETRATVDTYECGPEVLPALFEWAEDQGLTLYAERRYANARNAGNDNVLKTIPDLQEKDVYNPQTTESPNPVEPPLVDERLPSGLFRCPGCNRLYPNWQEYARHRPQCAEWANRDNPEANGDNNDLPEPDHGLYGDGAHYHELRQEPGVGTVGKIVVLPARTWKEAARVDGFMKYATAFGYANDDYHFYVAYRHGDPIAYAAVSPDGFIQMMHSAVENQGAAKAIFAKLAQHYAVLATNAANDKSATLLKRTGWVQSQGQRWRYAKDKAPTDLLEAPLPFIYDVQDDKITVGHPGARTSDIPGPFTPGGIVEGTYEPGGKVVVRSLTSIPYTVRHMVELWYYTHPQLEVKSVHLQDDAGKDTRLASKDIGAYVKQVAAIDPAVHLAATALIRAGGDPYVVGGAVRDALLGKEPDDIDLMVTGLPNEQVRQALASLPGNVVQEGNDFPVFHYRHSGSEVHIALPRTERSTGPGHTDFEAHSDHTLSPEEDFSRRDFTANAIGVNLRNGQLVDPYGGADDIANGVLRATTGKTLAEDPLRVLRGIGAHARHGLTPDEATRAQMTANAPSLTYLPAERIQPELDKIMKSDNPAAGIRLAHETGVLGQVLPEVEAAFGYDQNNPHHEYELGEHLLSVLDRTAQKTQDPDLRLAALLHDIGKPGSEWRDPGTGSSHYYEHHLPDGSVVGADHETLGAELAQQRLSALRYPNERTARVTDLVRHHMYPHFTTTRGARRFMARVGNHADDLFLLRWADQGGKSIYPSDPTKDVATEQRLVADVRQAGQAVTRDGLAVNGNDLIAHGLTPGPLLGQALSWLMEQVIHDPTLNHRDTLLAMIDEYLNQNGGSGMGGGVS